MKVPKFSRHATGVYFCKWNGRNHYFTRDEQESRKLYARHLREAFLPWKESKEQGTLEERAEQFRTGAGRELTLAELAELWLVDVMTRLGKRALSERQTDLKRFLTLFGALPASKMHARLLLALQEQMKKDEYAAATVNHDVKAVKMMMSWAADNELAPEIRLRGVRLLRRAPRNPVYLPPERVRELITASGTIRVGPLAPKEGSPTGPIGDARLPAWLSLQYLTCARRSEVWRAAHRMGEFVEHGLFVLFDSKTGKLTQESRVLVMSDEALEHFHACVPAWKLASSFGKEAGRSSGEWKICRYLRSSAASHLRRLRVPGEEIQLLLGHRRPGAWGNYVAEVFGPLRATAARLTLRS